MLYIRLWKQTIKTLQYYLSFKNKYLIGSDCSAENEGLNPRWKLPHFDNKKFKEPLESNKEETRKRFRIKTMRLMGRLDFRHLLWARERIDPLAQLYLLTTRDRD